MLKGVTEAIKNEKKEQRGGFRGTLVGTSGSILLENLLSGRGIARACSGKKKRKGIVSAGCGNAWDFLCHLIL